MTDICRSIIDAFNAKTGNGLAACMLVAYKNWTKIHIHAMCGTNRLGHVMVRYYSHPDYVNAQSEWLVPGTVELDG